MSAIQTLDGLKGELDPEGMGSSPVPLPNRSSRDLHFTTTTRRAALVAFALVIANLTVAIPSAAAREQHTAPPVPTGYAVDLGPVVRWYATALWDAHMQWNAAVEANARRSAAAVQHAVTLRIVDSPSTLFASSGSVNGNPCGGSLPSCCTLEHESGGNPAARNPSGAGGLWQFMPGTWNDYGGYSNAADAPPGVQNQKAQQVYAGGAGASNWYGDGCYPGG